VLKRVALETERVWMKGADPQVPWDILLFSAKESVFKAWFPATGTWLGFEHARIEFQPASKSFRAIILPHAPDAPGDAPSELSGRFRIDRERVLTSAFIPATLPQSRPSGWE
jgi:4'-phosphopantetheinyl transferase EntD